MAQGIFAGICFANGQNPSSRPPASGSQWMDNIGAFDHVMPQVTQKRIRVAAVAAIALFVLLFGQSILFHLFPSFAFRMLTGRPVPPGVRVVAYASEMTDNFFRSSYYWKLEHGPDGFTLLQQCGGFHTYSDDVAGHIAGVREAIAPGLRDEEISDIKQWSRSGKRSQIILQRRDGSVSYYVLSTI